MRQTLLLIVKDEEILRQRPCTPRDHILVNRHVAPSEHRVASKVQHAALQERAKKVALFTGRKKVSQKECPVSGFERMNEN